MLHKKSPTTVDVSVRANAQSRSNDIAPDQDRVEFVSAAPGIQDLLERIERIARSPAPVFITGESGTGKEVVARLIHQKSSSESRPWVAVNCAALPRDVVENELFGHEPEAFTGASSRRVGCFELADGGTLFLDEIAEIHPQIQAKLLRASELKTIRRLGGSRDIGVNVRIIAATNKDPHEAIAQGELRQDLYYRLSVLEVHLPPLRDRKTDVPLLVEHFLDTFSRKYGRNRLAVAPEAFEKLLDHDWPGNVREVRNLIESLVLLCPGDTIEVRHLPHKISRSTRPLETLSLPLGLSLDEVTRRYITHTLLVHRQNKSKAARILGISRKSLYDRLKDSGSPSDEGEFGSDD